MEKIADIVKGSSDRTMLNAAVAMEVVNAVNALAQMTVSPQGSGRFEMSGGKAVLTINGIGSAQIVRATVCVHDGDTLTAVDYFFYGTPAPTE